MLKAKQLLKSKARIEPREAGPGSVLIVTPHCLTKGEAKLISVTQAHLPPAPLWRLSTGILHCLQVLRAASPLCD